MSVVIDAGLFDEILIFAVTLRCFHSSQLGLQCDAGMVFLVHVTSPFLSSGTLASGVEALEVDGYDTVLSVSSHRTYAWGQDNGVVKPLNYAPQDIPQIQSLEPIFLETSGFYGFFRSNHLESRTRIHRRVKLITVDAEEAIDIDYPQDFLFAQSLQVTRYMLAAYRNHTLSEVLNSKPIVPSQKIIRHVVFDLDRVIVDSLFAMRASWEMVCHHFDMRLPFSSYKKHIGLPFF